MWGVGALTLPSPTAVGEARLDGVSAAEAFVDAFAWSDVSSRQLAEPRGLV